MVLLFRRFLQFQTLMSVPWKLMTVQTMRFVTTVLVASLVHVHLVLVEMAEQVLVGVDVQVHVWKKDLIIYMYMALLYNTHTHTHTHTHKIVVYNCCLSKCGLSFVNFTYTNCFIAFHCPLVSLFKLTQVIKKH